MIGKEAYNMRQDQIGFYWMAVSGTFLVLRTLAAGYLLDGFAKPFLEKPKRAVLAFAAYVAGVLLLQAGADGSGSFFVWSTGQILAFLVMCFADRRNYCQKIFIAVTFFTLRWLSFYMAGSLTGGLREWMMSGRVLAGRPWMQLAVFLGVELSDASIGCLVLGVSIRAILYAYVQKQEPMSGRELCMLTLPSVLGMSGYGMMQYYNRYYAQMTTIEAANGIYRGLAVVYYTISIVVIVVVTVMFQNMKAGQEEKLQKELLAVQLDSMRHHIGQVEALYEDIRGIRHDMANHIMTLEGLYEVQAADEARAYAADLKTALADAAGGIHSGNPVTDVILQEKKVQAQKAGLRFTSDFHYPDTSSPASGFSVHAFDISVILNNALQNAVEHASRETDGYVAIRSYCRKNAYMIEVRSRFTGTLKWDTCSGLPVTTKEKSSDGDAHPHGYGLANIRRVAQKYHGDLDIVLQKEEFCLSILLML